MFDINQELECSQSYWLPKNVRISDDGEHIIADLYYTDDPNNCGARGTLFNKITGVHVNNVAEDNPLRLRPKAATQAITHYFIHAGQQDWAKDEWVKLPTLRFDKGADAATEMKQHNTKAQDSASPFRFVVKKEVELAPILDYPSWMASRFASGEYTPVPWAGEPWCKEEHYAHLGIADSYMVAFVESPEAGQQDHCTTLSPGRYLQRYYSDVLTPTQIRDWTVKVDVESELKFTASDPDEIYALYTAPSSPHSCMIYDDANRMWRSKMNPVRVYGAGDLAVAYLERKGKIVGRALVWPDKKIAGRRYGDIERLDAALIAAGYTLDCETANAKSRGKGGFNGARLKLIVPEPYTGNYVMPYLDYYYKARRIPGNDEFLELHREGDIAANRTDGLAFEPGVMHDFDDDDGDYVTCYHCDDDFDEEDTRSVGHRTVCNTCYDINYTRCDYCDDTVRNSDINRVDGEDFCDSCHDAHTTSCDYCHDNFRNEQLGSIRSLTEGPDSHTADACQQCIADRSDIQPFPGHDDIYFDTGTATECEECGEHRSDDIDDCPTQSCVDARAETEELETA